MNYYIYIPHYTKLFDRKKDFIKNMQELNINDYNFYENFDKEEVNELEFIKDHQEIIKRIQKFIPLNVIKTFLRDNLNQAEKSISLKHKYIYKEFLKNNSKDKNLLVLEDDVILPNNFLEIINNINISQQKCIILGAGASVRDINKIKQTDTFFFNRSFFHPFSNGIEAYYMSYDTVEKVSNCLDKIKLCIPFDWELSNIFMEHNIECYHIQPYICYQGSMVGKYSSSIRENREEYGLK